MEHAKLIANDFSHQWKTFSVDDMIYDPLYVASIHKKEGHDKLKVFLKNNDSLIGYREIHFSGWENLYVTGYLTVEGVSIIETDYRHQGYGKIMYDMIDNVLHSAFSGQVYQVPEHMDYLSDDAVIFWNKRSQNVFVPGVSNKDECQSRKEQLDLLKSQQDMLLYSDTPLYNMLLSQKINGQPVIYLKGRRHVGFLTLCEQEKVLYKMMTYNNPEDFHMDTGYIIKKLSDSQYDKIKAELSALKEKTDYSFGQERTYNKLERLCEYCIKNASENTSEDIIDLKT